MTRGEDGLLKLKEHDQVPAGIAHFEDLCDNFETVILCLTELTANIPFAQQYKWLVIDTANGVERLAHEKTCEDKFHNDWGERGFTAFNKGPQVAMEHIHRFTQKLDSIRKLGLNILLICHTAAQKVPNPEGADYERWQPSLDNKHTMPHINKWADMVLFGCYSTVIKQDAGPGKKAKAIGGRERLIRATPDATFIAKNRHGLPDEIECGDSAADAWANFEAAIKK